MKILIKVANKKNLETLYRIRNYFLEKMDMLAQKLQYEIILNNQKQLKKTRI